MDPDSTTNTKYLMNVNTTRSGLQSKTCDEFTNTCDGTKLTSIPVRLHTKYAFLKAESENKEFSGYEISFKDVDRFIQPPLFSKDDCQIMIIRDII